MQLEGPHSVSLITTVAAALGLALFFGVVAARLKLPALIGYLVAGIASGASHEIARTLQPDIEIVVRTHSEEEAALLQRDRGR